MRIGRIHMQRAMYYKLDYWGAGPPPSEVLEGPVAPPPPAPPVPTPPLIVNVCNSPMLKLCHILVSSVRLWNSLPESIAACM